MKISKKFKNSLFLIFYFLKFFLLLKKKCYPISFPILGGRDSTRALQSTPFQNPGGVPRAWHTNERRTKEILVSNTGWPIFLFLLVHRICIFVPTDMLWQGGFPYEPKQSVGGTVRLHHWFKCRFNANWGFAKKWLWQRGVCVYSFSRYGSFLFGDQRGSIILNRAETSHVGTRKLVWTTTLKDLRTKYFRLGGNHL